MKLPYHHRNLNLPPLKDDMMTIYVLEDGETYSGEPAIPVEVTPEQLERIQGGEKVYNVVPDWMEPNDYALCVHCGASHHMDEAHQCEGGEE